MTTITTRSGKGSPLTNDEVDANFTNLNDDKIEASGDSMTGDLSFGDNNKAIFGAGSDLSIFHNGTTSVIEDSGTGNLQLRTSNLAVVNAAGTEVIMQGVEDGAVSLYHNAGAKLATTSTGIDVTGKVVSDGLDTSEDLIIRHSTTDHLQSILGTDGGGFAIEDNNYFAIWHQDIANVGTDTGLTQRFQIANNGDIQFYEDTGTTAKFAWDAADETVSIGLGASSTATISAFSRTVSANLPSALRIIENTGASTYWDIGANNGANPNLNFYVNANTSPKVTFASSGNVGINVTPESWLSSYKVLQIGDAGALVGSSDDSFVAVGANAYLDSVSSNYEYINSDFATQYYQVDGTHVWRNAASGTADATISWSEAMRIDASNNLLVGTTSTSTATQGIKLRSDLDAIAAVADGQISGYFGRLNSDGDILNFRKDGTTVGSIASVGGADIKVTFSSDGDQYITGNAASNYLTFSSANAERMRIDSSGNVGINQSNPTRKLHVTSAGSGVVATFGDSLANNTIEVTRTTTNASYIGLSATSAVGGIIAGPTFTFSTSNSGGGSVTERMRLDSSGNLLVGTTDSSVYNNSGSGTGINLQNFGNIAVARDGNDCMVLNRLNSDGAILNIAKDGTTVGSIGVEGSDLTIGTGDTGLQFRDASDAIRPFNISTNAARDANIDLGRSSERFRDLYLSGGAYLGGTAAANKLDDYETGTFTPVLADASTGGNAASGTSVGEYTKIGQQVFLSIHFYNINTTGLTSGNDIFIRDLPFTSKSITGSAYFTGTMYSSVLAFTVAQNAYPYLPDNTTYLKIAFNRDNAGVDFQHVNGITSGATDLSINISYISA